MANWQDLSMSQRGDIIKMAVNSGVTDLNRIKKLYEESDAPVVDEYNYDTWKSSLPSNLQQESPDYNLRGAYEAGVEPTLEDDGYYHLGSRNPYTGEILKRGSHPTFLEALNEDAKLGYYPYNEDGITYTDTWEGNKKLQELLEYYNDDEYAIGGHLFKGTNGSSKLKVRRPLKKEPLWASNEYTEIQDNTRVGKQGNRYQDVQNRRFVERADRGAKERSQWAKDHPILNTVGNIASTAPIAVAASPFITGIGSALANPYTNAALTSLGTAHGIQTLKEGNADAFTALELLPAASTINPEYLVNAAKIFSPAYRSKHAYNAVAPVGYSNYTERAKAWAGSMLRNDPIASDNIPNWYKQLVADHNGIRPAEGYTGTARAISPSVLNRGKIADEARIDAWALYNNQPQVFNTYIKTQDPNVYAYNMDKVMGDSQGTFNIVKVPKGRTTGQGIGDFVTGAGGNLSEYSVYGEDKLGNKVIHIGDLWDVQPFSRTPLAANASPSQIIAYLDSNPYKNVLEKIIKRSLGNPKEGSLLDKTVHAFTQTKPLRALETKLKNFELGSLTGGKPFMMRTNIPTHEYARFDTENPSIELVYGFNPKYIAGDEVRLPLKYQKPYSEIVSGYKNFPNFNTNIPNLNDLIDKSFAKGGKIKHKNEGFIPTNDDEFYRFLVNEEGFLKTPRNIGDGVITIGSGLTNKKYIDAYRKAGRWTEAMNRKAVLEEINNRRVRLSKDIPNWNSLPDTAKYALISYDYNYPLSAKKSPKLYAALKAKNWTEAAKQINATSKIAKFKNGLWNRRLREQNLFLRDFNNKPVIADRGPVLASPSSTIDLFMPARKALDFSQKAISYPTTRTAQVTKALLTTIRDQVPEEQKNSPIFNILPALESDNPNIAQVPLRNRDINFNTIPRPEIPQAELIPLDEEYGDE